jgi:transcriptional regulator with XRE-family HTH domain
MIKDIKRFVLEAYGRQLAEARMRKQMSQRGLAQLVAMTQANVSKVERGQVDLRLSSLVELARTLDLDVQLVPRQVAAAVEGVRRAAETQGTSRSQSRVLALLAQETKLLGRLLERYPQLHVAQQFLARFNALQGRRFDPAAVRLLQQMALPIEHMVTADTDDPEEVTRMLDRADRHLSRLEALSTQSPDQEDDAGRPAFRLDERDDD